MVDPNSIVLGALIGGAAGKFAGKAVELGCNWLAERFKGHLEKAKEKAQENALDFLAQLAQRVKTLEEQGEQYKEIINESLNQPDFSALLQKAVMSSAQTEDKQKHEILARLVADRLTKGSESLVSLTSHLACDAISHLTIKQMKILGILAVVFFIRPSPFPSSQVVKHDKVMSIWWLQWLEDMLKVYQDVAPYTMDFLHLESLSCIKYDSIVGRGLEGILSFPKESGLKFDYKMFSEKDVGKNISKLWKLSLQHAFPTTTGILIGTYVSDLLQKTTTSLDGWGES